jgi:hypothetical protein
MCVHACVCECVCVCVCVKTSMQREEEEGGQGVKELFHAVVEIKKCW